MAMTETSTTPGLIKPAILFLAAAALVTLSSRAPAQDMSSSARAYAGEPKVRIRGEDIAELNPMAFADRVAARRDVRQDGGRAAPFPSGQAQAITPAHPLATLFATADCAAQRLRRNCAFSVASE